MLATRQLMMRKLTAEEYYVQSGIDEMSKTSRAKYQSKIQ
jgi:hypothetical protein